MARVPVRLVTREDEGRALGPVLEGEGPRADRAGAGRAVGLTFRLDIGGLADASGRRGQQRMEHLVRPLHRDRDLRGTGLVDALDVHVGEVPEGGRVEVTAEAEYDVVGGHRAAVVEGHAL